MVQYLYKKILSLTVIYKSCESLRQIYAAVEKVLDTQDFGHVYR